MITVSKGESLTNNGGEGGSRQAGIAWEQKLKADISNLRQGDRKTGLGLGFWEPKALFPKTSPPTRPHFLILPK